MFYIFTSVDVEGVHGDNAPYQMIDGKMNGYSELWGISKLFSIFKKFNIPATFFVDIYENSFWGNDYMRQVCLDVKESGFDLQLHTHPGWRIDKRDNLFIQELKKNKSFLHYNKDFMAKLSLEDQIKVLSYGKQKIFDWVGEYPISHRSGGYSIDQNTLIALKKENFLVDSSMNFVSSNSRYCNTINSINHIHDILELPVTVLSYNYKILNSYNIYSKMLHTDIVTMSCDDLIKYIDQSIENGNNYLSLFMHSYSLLKYNYRWKKFRPNYNVYNNLFNFINKMNLREDITFVDTSIMYNLFKNNVPITNNKDFTPALKNNQKIISLGLKKISHKIQNLFL